MTIADEMKEIISRRKSIHPEWADGLDACWQREVQVLSKSIPDTIEYLKVCSDDDFAWVGEVFDDLISVTQSRELMRAIKERFNMVSDPNIYESLIHDIEFAENSFISGS